MRKHLYFRRIVAQFNRPMTRRFSCLFIFAGLLLTADSLCADTTNVAQVKSAILENNVAYLRVSSVGQNLADEIQSAQSILAAMNKLSGTASELRFANGEEAAAMATATNSSPGLNPLLAVRGTPATNRIIGTILDLRYASGDDVVAAQTTAKLFASPRSPLAILVNDQTRGAAATLAADLRQERAGLIFGGAAAGLKPDIAVTVNADDANAFFQNPYAALAQATTNSTATTNSFSPFIDHTSEADLVRAKIKDGEQDENILPVRSTEPPKPFIHDPVLARAVDLIKALAIVRPSQS